MHQRRLISCRQSVQLESLEARRLMAAVTLSTPLPTSPAAGSVAWNVRADSSPAFIDFYIDGQRHTRAFNKSSVNLNLDTTRLVNGKHELLAVSYGTGDARLAEMRATFVTDNGHARRDVRPLYQTIYIKPGESTHLALQTLYTDGTTSSFSGDATFTSADSTVASVDSSGLLHAARDGVTMLSVSAAGFASGVNIVVDSTGGFAHFGRDGAVLTQYAPGESTFVRTMFNLDASAVQETPGLASAVRQAGINALTSGFYQNPADTGASSYSAWKAGFEASWNRIMQTASAEDFSLFLIGDDIARSTAELGNSVNNAWSADAIRHALNTVGKSDRVTAIDMVDEINQLWGNTPSADFRKLMAIVNSAVDRPQVSWPVISNASPEAVRNWLGDPSMSDYTSHYWDVTEMPADGMSPSLAQLGKGMKHAAVERLAFVQRDTPVLMLTSASGAFYKNVGAARGDYLAGEDQLYSAGNSPASVAMQIMNAAALGAAGVRTYGYDGNWDRERDTAGNGQDVQTGADPFDTGVDRWRAMSGAFNTLGAIEQYLLQEQISALDLGTDFVTSARSGVNGRLYMAVNNSAQTITVDVNLLPYAYTGGTVTRYRVAGESATQGSSAEASGTDRVTFAPGEAIVWIATPSATTPTPPVTPPNPETPAPATPSQPAPGVPGVPGVPGLPGLPGAPDETPSGVPTTPLSPVPPPATTTLGNPATPVTEPVGTTVSHQVAPRTASPTFATSPNSGSRSITPKMLATDHRKPKVSFTSVKKHQKVFGEVAIVVSANDNLGVDRVVLSFQKKTLGVDRQGPYSFVWNTAGLKAGTKYTLTARAYDLAGNWRKKTISLKVIHPPATEAFALLPPVQGSPLQARGDAPESARLLFATFPTPI